MSRLPAGRGKGPGTLEPGKEGQVRKLRGPWGKEKEKPTMLKVVEQ